MSRLLKTNLNSKQLFDLITVGALVIGLAALAGLMYYHNRPLKLVDIKVPVATDKAEYVPGGDVYGIFFGEVYETIPVKIYRTVFCKNYKAVLLDQRTKKEYVETVAQKRQINGIAVNIGHLPADVPIGENCVIQFVNEYNINTPFGNRSYSYDYYTQNFKIISNANLERQHELNDPAKLEQERLLREGGIPKTNSFPSTSGDSKANQGDSQ